jgi:hypothetical protein
MKQFDFEQVGKRMPYNVPDEFFDKFEENVMKDVRGQKDDVREGVNRNKAMRIALRAAIAVAAALALFFVVRATLLQSEPVLASADDFESVELAFNNLSTEDQDFLIQVYEEDDVLINDFDNP